MSENKIITLHELNEEEIQTLVGVQDHNLDVLSSCFDVSITLRDASLSVWDCDEKTYDQIEAVVIALCDYIQAGKMIHDQNIIYAASAVKRNEKPDLLALESTVVGRTLAGKAIVPKTNGQLSFVRAMNENTVVFAIGPAGTGKTYLAVIQAVSALKRGEVKRIVLTRPAVEAGENLGFLPGDLKEKVDPYLTPLYDALHVMLGKEKTEMYIEKGIIEIAPLAYMRGRTLDDAFVILDEAQNTTTSQMKMFLTRLGFHSRMVITGDITQIDLDHRTPSGLVQATRILNGIDSIAILKLTAEDVVRHPLVQKIIQRYDAEDASN